MNTQKTGRNKPRGRGGGRGHTRRHPAATEHTAGAEDKQREGRKGGRREGHGWPCAWRVEEGNTAAGREQGENEKKERYKYLRERREKNAAETRKSVQVCAYTFYLISRRVGCLLHFLLYI